MKRFFSFVAILVFPLLAWAASGYAAETNTDELMKPVSRWVDAFNRWDFSYLEGGFTEDATVMDQFSPFVWTGQRAPRIWWSDLMGATTAIHEKRSNSKQKLTLEKPAFVQIKDDKAYFVMPATLVWTDKRARTR